MNGLLLGGIIGEGLKSFVSSYNAAQDRVRQQAESDEDRAFRRKQMKMSEKEKGLIWNETDQDYSFEGGNGSIQQKRQNDALEKQLDNVRQTYSALTEDQKQGTAEGQEMLRNMQALEKRLRDSYSKTYGEVGVESRNPQENAPALGAIATPQAAPVAIGAKQKGFLPSKGTPAQQPSIGGMTPVPGYKSKAERETEKAVATERAKQLALGTGSTEMRKEFIGQQAVKDMQNVSTAYAKVSKAAQNPSAAGDLSLIFGYMKMLDPGSTVREGEFANAQNAAGIPDQVLNAYNRARKGERLNPAQREDFVNQAAGIYEAQLGQFQELKNSYDQIARKQGFDPAAVTGVYNFKAPVKKEKKTAGPPPGSIINSNGKRYQVGADGETLNEIK